MPKCIPLTILALVVGLIAGAMIVTPLTASLRAQHRDVGIASPVITFPPAKEEDDPTWDCYEDGNRICGDAQGIYADAAWDQWDSQNAATRLKVDPSREYRVEYVGTAQMTPGLQCNEVAVPSLNIWYVFRATYLDGTAACP